MGAPRGVAASLGRVGKCWEKDPRRGEAGFLGFGVGILRAVAGGRERVGGAKFFEHGSTTAEQLGEYLTRHAFAALFGFQLGEGLVFGGLPCGRETRCGDGEALFCPQENFQMPQAVLFGLLREALDFKAEIFPLGFLGFGFVPEFLEGFGEDGDLVELGAFFGAEVAPGEGEFDAQNQGEKESRIQSESEWVE